MKITGVYIAIIINLCSINAISQNIDFGLNLAATGSVFSTNPLGKNLYSTSLFLEFTPKSSIISFQTGLSYYYKTPFLAVPLIVKANIGNDLTITPILGFSPFLRLRKEEYESRFSAIKQLGIGLEYKTNEQWAIFGSLGIRFIPSYYELPEKWAGESSYPSEIIRLPFLSAGIKYNLKRPKNPHKSR